MRWWQSRGRLERPPARPTHPRAGLQGHGLPVSLAVAALNARGEMVELRSSPLPNGLFSAQRPSQEDMDAVIQAGGNLRATDVTGLTRAAVSVLLSCLWVDNPTVVMAAMQALAEVVRAAGSPDPYLRVIVELLTLGFGAAKASAPVRSSAVSLLALLDEQAAREANHLLRPSDGSRELVRSALVVRHENQLVRPAAVLSTE